MYTVWVLFANCTATVLLLYCYCTATVLLLYCYCTAIVLLLYCCCTATVLLLYCYCTATVLLLYCYCTATVLLLYCYCTVTVLLLYCCCTAAVLLLYCYCTVLLLYCYCTVTVLLLYCYCTATVLLLQHLLRYIYLELFQGYCVLLTFRPWSPVSVSDIVFCAMNHDTVCLSWLAADGSDSGNSLACIRLTPGEVLVTKFGQSTETAHSVLAVPDTPDAVLACSRHQIQIWQVTGLPQAYR